MVKKVETNSLLKQTAALGNYLDEMLYDATHEAEQEVAQIVNIESLEKALLAEVVIEEVEVKNVCLTERDIEEKNIPVTTIDCFDSQSVEVEPEQSKPSDRLELSQFPIQCLMFRVGNNLLSLPLIHLSGVVPWCDELTQLPQSPDYMFGLLKHRESNLRVVDSSKVLGIPAITGQTPGHIIVLSGSQWAISCDLLEDVVTLEYNDIQWHQDPGNGISTGTIRETLAYLLSPSGIIKFLEVADEL